MQTIAWTYYPTNEAEQIVAEIDARATVHWTRHGPDIEHEVVDLITQEWVDPPREWLSRMEEQLLAKHADEVGRAERASFVGQTVNDREVARAS